MKSPKDQKPLSTRHLDKDFAERFKKTCLYEFYRAHSEELIIGIRNQYINIYRNCDSIAKVWFTQEEEIRCEINGFYLDGCHAQGPVVLTSDADIRERIVNRYEDIARLSDTKGTNEKKAQHRLYKANNANPESHWLCVDVEWVKPRFKGRFDLVAVSKSAPHQIAIIELKYGNGALGGNSGVMKHVGDFKAFVDRGYMAEFQKEVADMIEGLKSLDVPMPIDVSAPFSPAPQFYFIVLDNNPKTPKASTPRQTMGAYLFEEGSKHYLAWGSKRPAHPNAPQKHGVHILDKNSPYAATCLFSTQTLENLRIKDILDDPSYLRIIPE